MARITYVPNRVIDSDGIADGAAIYVYQTGGTTLVPLFSDSGYTVPVTNPYVVTTGAVVPTLFTNEAGGIRVRIVSSDGGVPFDEDPYTAFVTYSDYNEDLAARPAFDVRGIIGGDGEIAATLTAIEALGGRAWIAEGSYTIASETEIGDMQIEAHPNAVIKQAVGFTGTYMLKSTGTFTQIADLSANVSGGGTTLTFATAPALETGDWICIYNPTNGSWLNITGRVYYRAGEWCQVAAVSGTTVTLTAPLVHSYTAASVDVYLLAPKRPSIRGGQWSSGTKAAFKFTGCTGNLLDKVSSGNLSAPEFAYVDRCVAANVNVGTLVNAGSGSDDYGISVGNSHKVNIRGESIHARRHAVAIGGGDFVCSVPSRYVLVQGLALSNDPASGVYTSDFHGNSEYCEYIDCDIKGSIGIGGKDNGYDSCYVGQKSNGWCAEITEPKGGRLYATNCTFTTYTANPTNGCVFDLGYNSNSFDTSVTDTTTIDFSGARLFAGSLAAGSAIGRFNLAGSTATINFKFDDVELNTPNACRVLQLARTSGTADSDFIIVDRIRGLQAGSFYVLHSTSEYLNFPHRLPRQNGNLDATTSAAEVIIATAQTYTIPYPRNPHALVGAPGSQDGSAFTSSLGNVNNAAAVPFIYTLTESDIRLGIRSGDGVAFAASQNFRIPWSVELREV